MAIVVLVLWLVTAGAGFYLLVTSNLGRARPAAPLPAAPVHAAPPPPAPVPTPTVPTPSVPTPSVPITLTPGAPVPAAPGRQPAPAPARTQAGPASRREMRRAARDRWDPPSLIAAKQAPIVPGARSVLEFAHPACSIIGLGFWLGFTLVHNRALAWIAFGLIAVTACLGLTWFAANIRAVRHGDRLAPHFAGRLMVLHGSAAAITLTLAALSALLAWG